MKKLFFLAVKLVGLYFFIKLIIITKTFIQILWTIALEDFRGNERENQDERANEFFDLYYRQKDGSISKLNFLRSVWILLSAPKPLKEEEKAEEESSEYVETDPENLVDDE